MLLKAHLLGFKQKGRQFCLVAVNKQKISYLLSAEVFCRAPNSSGGSVSKESACNTGDLDSIPGLERSLGGQHGNPLQYSCLKNLHEQRSLVGYGP